MNASGVRLFGFAAVIAVLLAGAAMLPMVASSVGSDEPREVRLVARGMAYYLPGEAEANPTLRLRAGEEIRLVLRNEDGGMNHDFSVTPWKVGTALIEGKGETSIVFRVPDSRGSTTYACTPHSIMMRGTIVVE